MIRHGVAPFLECSSKGDKRFSAFSARLRKYGNSSIEEIYQASKKFPDGSTGLHWRQAKGRQCINPQEVARLYSQLWDLYIAENPDLVPVLIGASGVSDIFGQDGHVCQATELWRIRHVLLQTQDNDMKFLKEAPKVSPNLQSSSKPVLQNQPKLEAEIGYSLNDRIKNVIPLHRRDSKIFELLEKELSAGPGPMSRTDGLALIGAVDDLMADYIDNVKYDPDQAQSCVSEIGLWSRAREVLWAALLARETCKEAEGVANRAHGTATQISTPPATDALKVLTPDPLPREKSSFSFSRPRG